MTLFQYPSRITGPIVALLGLAASSVYAQTAINTNTASAGAPAVPSAFSSVFDSYQPYTEEKTGNWKQANDNTARIGGWRAYAKEAAEPASATLPTPATPATPPAKP